MLPIARIAFAAWLTAVAGAASAQAPLTPEDLYRQVAPSVWLVRAYDANNQAVATGSAVVTGPDTLLTNCHVLRRAAHIVVRYDAREREAELLHADTDRDLCRIGASGLGAPAVAVADSDRLVVGQRVFAIGNPRGLERTLSDGLVSALRRDEKSGELLLIQTSAPISPGSSGGGLFDSAGRLVGITTLAVREGQNLNFAVPINWARDLGAKRTAAPGSAPGPADIDAVPVSDHCKAEYRRFLAAPAPKAFAITTKGKCAWQNSPIPSRPQITSSPDPVVRAMEVCVHFYGSGCMLYAVDNKVVWQR